MNDNDLLEQELNSLGDELRAQPSVAKTVMQRIAEVHTTGHAASSPVVAPASPIELEVLQPTGVIQAGLRRRQFASMTAALAALAATIVAIVFLRTDSVAFAQVGERLGLVRTATFTMTRAVVRRLPSGETTPVEIQHQMFVRTDGRIRTEWPEGKVTVTSPEEFVALETDPTKQTATLRYLYELENRQDIVATLRSLHRAADAFRTATKTIDGIDCPGFRIEERDATLLVWVNPTTYLPVRAERSYAKALSPSDQDVVSVTERYDNMKFDEPLADEMFSVTPPVGYVVTTEGTPPVDRRELFSNPLVVTPNVGVGPLKFGASRDEILRILGKPDSESISVPSIPIDDKTSNVGGQERPPGASLVVLTKFHIFDYRGLGLTLTVEATDGLVGIQCIGQDSIGATGRTFRGATDKGIRIGASEQEIIEAYGKPDEVPTYSRGTKGNLKYRDLHMEFVMNEKRTVRVISLSDSASRPLRFEWQLPKD